MPRALPGKKTKLVALILFFLQLDFLLLPAFVVCFSSVPVIVLREKVGIDRPNILFNDCFICFVSFSLCALYVFAFVLSGTRVTTQFDLLIIASFFSIPSSGNLIQKHSAFTVSTFEGKSFSVTTASNKLYIGIQIYFNVYDFPNKK